ncbi:glycosyltransferase 87 family protein [Corynebacterium sp. UBA2622]|uniref:glycosyltransferase 87 family protein n=1 Tax=Corynebacterium sp. UBA2622 TaxID=1946393 RepID=UPI0025C00144|nr:glycosyltransferase 87 family protein [Corynebacterium sp. UBA2622]
MNYRRIAPLVLLALAVGRWFVQPSGTGRAFHPRYHIDVDVYRVGGRALLDGADLYSSYFPLSINFALPFTYPPFSALLSTVLAPLPLWGAGAAVTLVSLLALWLGMFLLLRELIPHRDYLTWSLWATLAGALTEPVTETLFFGQVNLILAALVLVDFFAVPRGSRWRGCLTGIAMAVKLTPAVFLAVPFVRREWRMFATIVASFITCGLLGFAVTPGNSREYWTETLRHSDRIGNASYAANQSLRGVLTRLEPGGAGTLWAIGAIVVVAVLWVIMEAAARRCGSDVGLVLLASSAALLCSPISWSHHFVWLTFAIAVMAATGHRAAAGLTWAVLVARGHWLVPPHHSTTDHWSAWQHIIGNDDFLLTCVLIGYAAYLTFSGHRGRLHPSTGDSGRSSATHPLGVGGARSGVGKRRPLPEHP